MFTLSSKIWLKQESFNIAFFVSELGMPDQSEMSVMNEGYREP